MKIIQGLLCIFITFILGYKYGKRRKDYSNPITFFIIYWGMIIGFASMELFHCIPISIDVYCILIIGCVSFVVPAIFLNMFSINYANTRVNIDNTINTQSMIALSYIVVFWQLIYVFKVMTTLLNSSLVAIKTLFYNQEIYSSSTEMIFYTYVLQPLVLILLCYAAINLFSNKRSIHYQVLTIISLLEITITTGRRTYLSVYIVSMAVILLREISHGRSFGMAKKTKKIIGTAAVVLVLLLRSTSESIFMRLYFYFCGCVPCFQQKYDVITLSKFKYTDGRTSFISIINFIDNFKKLDILEDAYNNMLMIQRPVVITTDTNYLFNAYVTTFFYNYLDGGIPYVIVLSALYAVITIIIYKLARRENNEKCLLLYVFWYNILFNSNVYYPFSSTKYLGAMIWICILFFSPLALLFVNGVKKNS